MTVVAPVMLPSAGCCTGGRGVRTIVEEGHSVREGLDSPNRLEHQGAPAFRS